MAAFPPDVEHSTVFFPNASAIFTAPFNPGGAAAFTIEAWVRVESLGTGPAASALLISQDNSGDNLFAIVITSEDGYPAYSIKVGGNYYVGPAVAFRQWVHLALTYDGANINLIVDGGLYVTAQQVLPALTSPAISIGSEGGPGAFTLSDFAMWSTCRTTAEVASDMWANPVPNANGLVFYGDFTQSPPIDLCGSTIGVSNLTFIGETPNLCNLYQGYAIPGLASDFNPSFAAPFSASSWICISNAAPNSAPLCIYSNGDASEANSWAICLTNGVVSVVAGPLTVATGGQLSQDVWYNVAVTYDGTTCTVYVDGAAVASGTVTSSPLPLGQSLLFARSVSQDVTNFFVGHMQFFTVWNICLTAAQVQASMYHDPSDDPACTGNIICSINPARDIAGVVAGDTDENDDLQLVTNSIGFDSLGQDDPNFPPPPLPSAAVTMMFAKGPPASSSLIKELGSGRSKATPSQAEPQRLGRGLFAFGARRRSPAVPFSQEHAALMKRDLRRFLGVIPSASARRRIAEEFERSVDETFELARRNALTQAYSYERRGKEWVILAHGGEGSSTLATYDAAITPECAVWWVTFVLTAISGVLQILGIPTPQERLQNLISQYVQVPTFNEALNAAIANRDFTVYTFLSVLKVLYSFGLLSRAFWLAVSALSWWAAAKAVAWLVSLVAPAATPQQVMLITNCAITVGRLVDQIRGYNAACPSSESEAA